ncbi:hypothetical protein DPMN_060997 [Dreissena polymorpha]|uniref:Uncharacterized protein n=1 Tax=Dreissena polymorpha TaxID=45954 RepID=A0A9D4C712_DREPO|nr:hypothetical protein DPMN_060997 [Dreissena polymorpha]
MATSELNKRTDLFCADTIKTNVLTNFHEERNAPPPSGHVFQQTQTVFKLIQDMIGTNLLTKFYEDWTIHVAFRVKNAPPPGGHVFQQPEPFSNSCNISLGHIVLTRFYYSHIKKNAPPPSMIGTNLLTKFHDDRTINITSRVLTRQILMPHDKQRTKSDTKAHHEQFALR